MSERSSIGNLIIAACAAFGFAIAATTHRAYSTSWLQSARGFSGSIAPAALPDAPPVDPAAPSSGGNATTFSNASTLKVIQFNVDHGGEDRRHNIMLWLRKQEADVVGFCEANGWENDFERLARMAGFSESAFFPTSHGYPLAVFSRTPIEIIGRHNDGFERGVLHVQILQHNFFIAHLNAHSSSARSQETALLSDLVRNASSENSSQGVIVMGDLNTLSPLDKVFHDNMTLENRPMLEALSTMGCYTALRRKFLRASQPGERAAFDYEAMQNLLSAELQDISRRRIPTEPTLIPCDQAKHCTCPHLRLDYMLVTKGLSEGVAEVVIDNETDVLSDHYPILGHFPIRK